MVITKVKSLCLHSDLIASKCKLESLYLLANTYASCRPRLSDPTPSQLGVLEMQNDFVYL